MFYTEDKLIFQQNIFQFDYVERIRKTDQLVYA